VKFIRSLYLNPLLFKIIGGLVVLFIIGFVFPVAFGIARILLLMLFLILVLDIITLYNVQKGLFARRIVPERLSNGDDNQISIFIESFYKFPVQLMVIDEIPFQFQKRDLNFHLQLNKGETKVVTYQLHPVERGVYSFGAVNIFIKAKIGLVSRKFSFNTPAEVAVYPSFIQMRKFEMMAFSNHLLESGIKKIRRIGQQMEFEQIKEYVAGDDFRTINWKATARKNEIMVNSYQDEKAQHIYSLIDKGRAMKMPFEGMTLLDYAINASLAISNIAVKKDDKPGLITFQKQVETFLPAAKRNKQMMLIQEALYGQKTSFKESDFSNVYSLVRKNIKQRSLFLLYTNFESVSSLERQMNYLVKLAKFHLLVVVFFKNTELHKILGERANNLEEIYTKTIGEKFAYEKRLIVKELNRYGIHSILTEPKNLTINAINKYLELKSRGLI
jgi:uncharacterized protein (DUF58 family)